MSSKALPVKPARPARKKSPKMALPGGGIPSRAATMLSLRILLILCIILPLLLYTLIGAYRYKQVRIETQVRLDRSLRIAQEHALKILDTNELVLDRVIDALDNDDVAKIRRREKAVHDRLLAISNNKPQIDAIWVYGKNGKPLVSDHVYPVPANLDISSSSYFAQHRDKPNGSAISKRLQGDDGPFFTVSRAWHSADGSFAGVVAISLLSSYFERFHSDLVADEPGLTIALLREDGPILSRWPVPPNLPNSLTQDSPVMTKIREGQLDGKVKGISSIDGLERLLHYSKIGPYPVFIVTGMDVKEIRSRWLHEIAWLGAFGLPPMISLLLAAFVAWRRARDALQAAEQLHDEIEARHRVEEALLQAQKLEALGRLTGGVAHDFNNALMVISNNLFLLKRKHPAADGPQTDSIGRAIQSATKLTRQLLAFSRRQAMVPQQVRLQDKLPGLADLLGPVLGGQITLSMEVAPDTETITVDSAEFELALINLAINARDAMPSDGKFSITARNAHELPPLLDPPMVVIEATDTGSGIDPALLNRVFEPFFTTKPVGQGTGLGLSQIYGLCQRAGGLATVSSEPGTGTTVSLFFPATPGPATESEESLPLPGRKLHEKVLLVEDNEDVAAALKPVLESMGCRVTHLNRGTTARNWLQQKLNQDGPQGDPPDVLLADVVMPGEIDGLALAQFAREKFPALKIILMTGYSEQIETIIHHGFLVLPKPCSADMLADAINGAGAATPAVATP